MPTHAYESEPNDRYTQEKKRKVSFLEFQFLRSIPWPFFFFLRSRNITGENNRLVVRGELSFCPFLFSREATYVCCNAIRRSEKWKFCGRTEAANTAMLSKVRGMSWNNRAPGGCALNTNVPFRNEGLDRKRLMTKKTVYFYMAAKNFKNV